MREQFTAGLLSLLACSYFFTSSVADARQRNGLDGKLEKLYSEVQGKFLVNKWFKNASNPDLYDESSNEQKLPPEFEMPTLDVFKKMMTSYCALRESSEGKRIGRLDRYTFVDFTKDSLFRRLYVYDVRNHEIIHNMWTSHGTKSALMDSITMKDTNSGYSDFVLGLDYRNRGVFYSNVDGSNQSSVGMALTENATYWSTQWKCNALRMNGVDEKLNSGLYSRAVVLHSWEVDPGNLAWFGGMPLSWGCVMLPKYGFYEGQYSAPIADTIIQDLMGGPVMLYHARMNPKDNERIYQEQLDFYSKIQKMLSDNLAGLAERYDWEDEDTSSYEKQLMAKLKKVVLNPIEDTYRYFKTPSKYLNQPLKSEEACEKALGID